VQKGKRGKLWGSVLGTSEETKGESRFWKGTEEQGSPTLRGGNFLQESQTRKTFLSLEKIQGTFYGGGIT